jgi:phospholipase D1/2
MKRILRPHRNVWCEGAVTTTGLLIDGDDYYRAFYDVAQQARHYILMAGWQFDSDACLLRGDETRGATLPVALKPFLSTLCDRTESLQIFMLAWDFHTVFALEREWMQEQLFNWTTNERLTFHFDRHHVDGGAHHQKFVVIDGEISFLGGLDLCDHRWDDRRHCEPNPLRVSRGEPHKPFHDVQAYVHSSQIAAQLTALFTARWHAAKGKPFTLPRVEARRPRYEPHNAVPLATSRIALSRTDPHGQPEGARDCREFCALTLDAVEAAERLIYVETQYLTSAAIAEGLVKRLRRHEAPLDVVIVLNMEAETFKEEVAVGLAQAKVIRDLREAATGSPHALGIYYTVPHTEDGQEPPRATYIHSKLMIVDDRFLTVGSANLTNRSCVVDSELNLSVEDDEPRGALAESVARARHGLLLEHLGVEELDESRGLVALLDEWAEHKKGRLRVHPSPTEKERMALDVVDPQDLPFDPDSYEDDEETRDVFAGGLATLWHRLMGRSSAPKASGAD